MIYYQKDPVYWQQLVEKYQNGPATLGDFVRFTADHAHNKGWITKKYFNIYPSVNSSGKEIVSVMKEFMTKTSNNWINHAKLTNWDLLSDVVPLAKKKSYVASLEPEIDNMKQVERNFDSDEN